MSLLKSIYQKVFVNFKIMYQRVLISFDNKRSYLKPLFKIFNGFKYKQKLLIVYAAAFSALLSFLDKKQVAASCHSLVSR